MPAVVINRGQCVMCHAFCCHKRLPMPTVVYYIGEDVVHVPAQLQWDINRLGEMGERTALVIFLVYTHVSDNLCDEKSSIGLQLCFWRNLIWKSSDLIKIPNCTPVFALKIGMIKSFSASWPLHSFVCIKIFTEEGEMSIILGIPVCL